MFAQPLVGKDRAIRRLTRRSGLLRRLPPRPVKAELVYFPYYLFRITVVDRERRSEIWAAADGVSGGFSFVNLGALEFEDEAEALRFDYQIGMEEARAKVLEEYRWEIFKVGFHRRHPPKIEAIEEERKIYYPYWVAYYRKQSAFDFKAIDGFTGEPPPVRMRNAFITAFAASKTTSPPQL